MREPEAPWRNVGLNPAHGETLSFEAVSSAARHQKVALGKLDTMPLPIPTAASIRQLLAFSIVGAVGFVIDSSVLYAAIALGLGLAGGRVVSYLAAVTVTWALNRRYTFADRSQRALLQQWARFAFTQLAGASVNLGSYYLLLHTNRALVAHWPVLAVAVGSLAGLSINFVVAKVYVFGAAKLKPSTLAG